MVYTGPSEGCYLCRKRRIKCDGGRPGCQRCKIYKMDCPGYRSESDYKFVNETSSSETKLHPSSRKRASPSLSKKSKVANGKIASGESSPSSSVASSASPLTSASSKTTPQTPPETTPFNNRECPNGSPNALSLMPQWDDWSVNAFRHDWTIASKGDAVGFLECLPKLSIHSRADLDFSLALKAASYASFANQNNFPEMMAKARLSYGRALIALNSSLANPESSLKDTTIASIVLLQIFEVGSTTISLLSVVGELTIQHITCDVDDSLSIGNHDAGLCMLFDMRGIKQFETPQGKSIARVVMGYLVCPSKATFGGPDLPITQRLRNVTQSKTSSELMRKGRHLIGYPPEHPARQGRPNTRNMTDGLAGLEPLLGQNPADPAVLAEGIAQLQGTVEFDLAHIKWEASLPPDWLRREVNVAVNPDRMAFSSIPSSGVVHVYDSPLTACYFNLHRIQCVILHKLILRVAAHLGIEDWSIPATEASPGLRLNAARSLFKVRQLNDEILASAACAMSEVNRDGYVVQSGRGRAVGAYYLLSPLTHIYQDADSTPLQKYDAGRALGFIGNVLGIRRGIEQMAVRSVGTSSPASSRKSSQGTHWSLPHHGIVSR